MAKNSKTLALLKFENFEDNESHSGVSQARQSEQLLCGALCFEPPAAGLASHRWARAPPLSATTAVTTAAMTQMLT
jgi:hypothetical protein